MPDFSKLAAYLDSFDEQHKDYAAVQVIKHKLAEDTSDPKTINNAEDAELDDNDVTMATPEQQAESNHEGELMSGAFRELEALNEIKKEKEEIKAPGQQKSTTSKDLSSGTPADFPGVGQTHNQVSKLGAFTSNKKPTLFDLLKKRLSK